MFNCIVSYIAAKWRLFLIGVKLAIALGKLRLFLEEEKDLVD